MTDVAGGLVGGLSGALIAGLGTWAALRTHRMDADVQRVPNAVEGFDKLTARLSEQLAQRDGDLAKLKDEMQRQIDHLTIKFNTLAADHDECERGRAELSLKVQALEGEVVSLRTQLTGGKS